MTVPVGDLRRVCPGESSPPPNWQYDFCDFPTGWFLARQGLLHTDRRCSYVQTNGAILCDCGAIEVEWARRRCHRRYAQGGPEVPSGRAGAAAAL